MLVTDHPQREPNSPAQQVAASMARERAAYERKVREAALDRAIQACGGRASAEELVASAKLFVAFIAGEQQ